MVTWTDTDHFTAVSGCSVVDGSAVMTAFDRATIPHTTLITALDLDEQTGTYYDKVGSNHATATSETRVSAKKNYGASFAGAGKIALPQNAITGYSGALSFWFLLDAGNTYEGLFSFGSTSNINAVILDVRNNETGAMRVRVGQNVAGSPDVYNYLYGSTTISYAAWHHLVLSTNGTTWKLYIDGVLETLTVISGSNTGAWASDVTGTALDTVLANRRWAGTDNRPLHGDMDEITFWSGELDQNAVLALYYSGAGRFHFDHTAVVSVHDDGDTKADAGAATNACFDYSTSTKSTSANATVSSVDVFSSDNSGATPSYSNDASWLAHLARAVDGNRYLWRKLNFVSTNRYASQIDSISTDAIIYDFPVGAPADPTAAAYASVSATKFALDWSEPSDADFSHCRVKRTIDGETMEYLQYAGGVISWEAIPSNEVFFRENDFGTCVTGAGDFMSPFSHFVDEDSAENAVYWVQAVDYAGNATQWVALSLYVGGADFPDPSNVASDDTVNGQAGTLTLPDASLVYVGTQYGGGGNEFTGTYDPDFPDASNVTTDDTVNGETGTFSIPSESNVVAGVEYGSGAEFTGTYTPSSTPPDAPALVSLTVDDGSVTASVTLNNDDDPAYIIYRVNGGAWSSPSESLKSTADGDIEIGGLTNDVPIQVCAISIVDDLYSLPSVVLSATPTANDGGVGMQVAAAITAELNATEFSQSFTAVRGYIPMYKLDEIDSLKVTVMLRTDERENIARGMTGNRVTVDVAIQKRFDSHANSAIDPLMVLGREIQRHFERLRLPGMEEAAHTGTENEPAYIPEHMMEWRQFTSVISLSYLVME